MMIDAAYCQIGKRLGLPTHAYIGLSDSKCVDAQAGLETGAGAMLGALCGINVMSGGGMMDYESAQSLEKLVIDNDICGMAYRLVRGIEQRDEPMAIDLYAEPKSETEFLTHPHTLMWHSLEQSYPHVINRDGYEQWVQSGKPDLADRASVRVSELLEQQSQSHLSVGIQTSLRNIMTTYAASQGFSGIPEMD
jgi:trimethylamine--corrinoid protein Co-methyltransferase